MTVNTGNNHYFEEWGFLEEKVERRGKGDQNVWNEPINAPLNPWVPLIACLVENSFSKLKNFQNYPYFNDLSLQIKEGLRREEITVILENIDFWKTLFC